MKIAIIAARLLLSCPGRLDRSSPGSTGSPTYRLPRGRNHGWQCSFPSRLSGRVSFYGPRRSIGDPTGPRVAPIALRTSHRAATTGRDMAPRRYYRTRYWRPWAFFWRPRYYSAGSTPLGDTTALDTTHPGGSTAAGTTRPEVFTALGTTHHGEPTALGTNAPRRAYRARYYAPRRAYRARAYAPRRAYRAVRCVGFPVSAPILSRRRIQGSAWSAQITQIRLAALHFTATRTPPDFGRRSPAARQIFRARRFRYGDRSPSAG